MGKTSRRAEHVEDTRTGILDVAEELFTEPGYAAASVDEIAERARVTKGAVYHHFGSKPGLFRAVVERLFQRLVGDLASAAEGLRTKSGRDLWDVVCAVHQKRLDLVGGDPAYRRIVDQDALSILGYDEVTRMAHATGDAVLVPVLAEAIDGGLIKPVSPDVLAKLMGALISVAGREIAAASDPQAREEVAHALDVILQGLRR
jgi:AcrR family transcriptional regulator